MLVHLTRFSIFGLPWYFLKCVMKTIILGKIYAKNCLSFCFVYRTQLFTIFCCLFLLSVHFVWHSCAQQPPIYLYETRLIVFNRLWIISIGYACIPDALFYLRASLISLKMCDDDNNIILGKIYAQNFLSSCLVYHT